MRAVDAALAGLTRLNDGLLAVCKHLVIGLVAALAFILIAAVFWRYALNDAISWSEEGSKYLMVWLTFVGAPIALRHGAHVNIDLLVELPALSKAQAIIAGSAVNTTVLCRVRERLTAHGGMATASAEEWTGYFRPEAVKRREADEALFPKDDPSSERDLTGELFGDG